MAATATYFSIKMDHLHANYCLSDYDPLLRFANTMQDKRDSVCGIFWSILASRNFRSAHRSVTLIQTLHSCFLLKPFVKTLTLIFSQVTHRREYKHNFFRIGLSLDSISFKTNSFGESWGIFCSQIIKKLYFSPVDWPLCVYNEWNIHVQYIKHSQHDAIIYLLLMKFSDSYKQHPASRRRSPPSRSWKSRLLYNSDAFNEEIIEKWTGEPRTQETWHITSV